MAVSTQRVLLNPREHLAYGQDFHTAGLMEHCGLTLLKKREGEYHWPHPDPELIITQNPDDLSDANFVAGMGNKVAVVAHVHCRWDYYTEDQKNIVHKTLLASTAGVVPAQFHKQEMEREFPHLPWYVAANGVRTDLFRPSTQKERDEFKYSHLISADTKLVGFAGRIESAKGIQVLKKICARIAAEPFVLFVQFPAWQEVREKAKAWARTEQFVQEIRALNPRKVIVWGDHHPRLNNRPVRFFDVFLTPSLSEVQPLVVLEALVSGVPVVATDATPFYAELRKEMPALEPSSMQIAPLDERFSQGATARESTLTDFEVTSLSQDLIDKIKNVGIYGYKEREQLSTQMILAGFAEASMNARFALIYDDVVERLRVKLQGVHSGGVYPLTLAYVDIAPTDVGVIRLLRDGVAVRIASAENPDIRTELLSTLNGQLRRDEQPNQFWFEVCQDPKRRQLELLSESEGAHLRHDEH